MDKELQPTGQHHKSLRVLTKQEATIDDIAEIVAGIWRSGKNDSQAFDFHECSVRERWVARLCTLITKPPDEEKVAEKICTLNWNVKSWGELSERVRESWREEARQILDLMKGE